MENIIYAFEMDDKGENLKSVATAYYSNEEEREKRIKFINGEIAFLNIPTSNILVIDGKRLGIERKTSIIQEDYSYPF